MKINTFSQNKLSFGVRKPFNDELKIDTLRKTPYPYIPDNRVHDLLFEKIMSANGDQCLRSLFHQVKNGSVSKDLKKALNTCKDNLKRIFWETCDRFFDVQLTKPGDQLRGNDERHIPDDDELEAIFPAERASFIDTLKDAENFIDYFCHYSFETKQKGKKLNEVKMVNSFFETSSKEVKEGTLKQYKVAINRIKAHLDESIGKTEEEFQEYMVKKYDKEIYTIIRNKELFSYALRKLKELKQKMAKIGIVSYGDIKTTNTKKFIDYYCHCYFEAKQKGKKLNEVKMVNSFFKTSSKEAKNGTLIGYKCAIKMIYSNLDKSIDKTDEEFQEYIVKEYGGKTYTIIRNKELFSYAVDQLKELKRKMAEIEIAQSPQETRQIATGEIESFSYENVKTTNTKKFIDYYCSCYFEAKQKGKKLDEVKMVNSFIETSSKKVPKGTLMQYKIAINKIKNHLDESIGKTVEEFRQYIMNECNGKLYTICKNKELFSYAVDKLIELEQEMAEIEIALVPQETRQTATGEIERDPYEVTLNNQWNEDGNFDSFKSSGDNDQELLDLLCPQSSDADDPGLTGDDLFDSLVIEEHGMFSRIPSLPSLDDLGLSGNNLVGSQVLEEHGMFSDRFNLPNLEDFEFGLNSSQFPDTNSFANDNKLNLSRPHESYDDAYSDKRRKM